MRIYLSGPMSGYRNFNIPAFEEAAAKLRAIGYSVVSPHEIDAADGIGDIVKDSPTGSVAELTERTGFTWGTLLARDVKIIADDGIQAIYVLPGWESSKGAKLEVFLGLLLGIEVHDVRTLQRIPRLNVLAALFRSFLEN